ncbi:hypothetical protein L345_11107, partial [Ophiophagus hannah]
MYNHLSHLIPTLFLVIGQERSELQVTLSCARAQRSQKSKQLVEVGHPSLRCHSPLSENLPDDEKPKCQPYWEDNDPSMPLPFNLEDIIFELQTMLED